MKRPLKQFLALTVSLLIFASFGCGEAPDSNELKIRTNGATVERSIEEVRSGISSGFYDGTTEIWNGQSWTTLDRHPATRSLFAPKYAEENEEFHTINIGSPGLPIDIREYAVEGKITIFDFHSEYCPPCVEIAPYLQRMAIAREDIVVRKVDINREQVRGIDFLSPLARQYAIQELPSFFVFDQQAELAAKGKEAKEIVVQMIEEVEIARQQG